MNKRMPVSDNHKEQLEVCKNIFICKPGWWAIIVSAMTVAAALWGGIAYERRLESVEDFGPRIDKIEKSQQTILDINIKIDTLLQRTAR